MQIIKLAHVEAEIVWGHSMAADEAFATAIEAMEKQVAKKPTLKYEGQILEVYECPNCGDDWNTNEFAMSYCWNCGQKLDFEVEE